MGKPDDDALAFNMALEAAAVMAERVGDTYSAPERMAEKLKEVAYHIAAQIRGMKDSG